MRTISSAQNGEDVVLRRLFPEGVRADDPTPHSVGPRRPSGRFLAGLAAFYAACLIAATWPAALTWRSRLAVGDPTDPLMHLRQMRWYRACLTGWTSPLFCPDLQRPLGSPLGLYSPLQLQTLGYLGLSLITKNDTLMYNLILFSQLVYTGMGTFALAWYLTRHRGGSSLSGLLAMLSAPMLFNAMVGGTELLALGSFPLFFVGWMRLLERPTAGRLAAAVGLFLLLAASAPYYGFLAVAPAMIHAFVMARGGGLAWCRSRVGWLLGFGALAATLAPLLFPGQIWAVGQGYSMARPREHFERYGTTPWHYLVPWPTNLLGSLIAPPFGSLPGFAEKSTIYLGVVALGLLAWAAVVRVSVKHGRTLWACLAVLVILSIGANMNIGGRIVPMPASWLWDHCPGFRSLRVPARFGYLAVVCAAVLAGAAAGRLIDGAGSRWRKAAIGVGLAGLAVVDLAMVPCPTRPIPPMPPVYATLLRSHPDATLCEVHPNGDYVSYESTLAYWQGMHGGKTSAGNPGVENRRLTHLTGVTSPFYHGLLGDPGYLTGPSRFDIVGEARFEDYAWLYLTTHKFDYLVLHTWSADGSPTSPVFARIRGRLAEALIHEDATQSAFDRRRLATPDRPVALLTSGWRDRIAWRGVPSAIAAEDARVAVYNPSADRPLRLRLVASAYLKPRVVRLLAEGRELARWRVVPGAPSSFQSPPFRLGGGIAELSIASDGSERPARISYAPVEGDMAPISLWVAGVRLGWDGAATR